MHRPASYLVCIWSFSFKAKCHLRVKFELRFLDAIDEQVPSYSASIPMDQFDRASYDFTSWYLRVVASWYDYWERGEGSPSLAKEYMARQKLEEEFPGLSASVS